MDTVGTHLVTRKVPGRSPAHQLNQFKLIELLWETKLVLPEGSLLPWILSGVMELSWNLPQALGTSPTGLDFTSPGLLVSTGSFCSVWVILQCLGHSGV